MRGTWLALFLVVTAPAVARAQATPAVVAVSADPANTAVTAAEQRLAKLTAQRAQLDQRLHAQTDAIDRIKQEKASWRRDRELRSNLADAQDTANQLAALDGPLAKARDEVAKARKALLAAIDAETAAGATGPRAQKLAQLRAQLAAQLGPAPKKIVMPDAEIDPLADPEELEEQASAIRISEKQLSTQVADLGAQAEELTRVADVRKQHDRAVELGLREDDQPHRAAQSSTRVDGAATPTVGGAGGGSGADFGGDHNNPTTVVALDTEAIVLGEVIDHQTIESLTRASHSNDPAQRAIAAKQARDAVAARLESLRKKREQIELRAKQLRAKH